LELNLPFRDISFHRFKNAIKLNGYRRNLTSRDLNSISLLLNLDLATLKLHPESPLAHFLADPEFLFADKEYKVKRLLSVGFLHCEYEDELSHAAEL